MLRNFNLLYVCKLDKSRINRYLQCKMILMFKVERSSTGLTYQWSECCYSNSLCNRSFAWRLYVDKMLFGFFCGCWGFCHRTESDIFLFSSIKCLIHLVRPGLSFNVYFFSFYNVSYLVGELTCDWQNSIHSLLVSFKVATLIIFNHCFKTCSL